MKSLKKLDLKNISSRSEATSALSDSFPDPSFRAFLLRNLFRKNESELAFRIDLDIIYYNLREIEIALPKDLFFDGKTLFIKGDKSDYIDDKKMVLIQDRLSEGYSLQKKHKVQSTNELISIQQQLELDLTAVLSLDEEINQLTKQVKADEKQVVELATSLTQKRNKETAPFTKNVNQLLYQVGMPNAKIKVTIDEVAYNAYGKDKIDFLFDANNTQKFEPIKKVASGGELSRLMLSLV